MKFKQPIHIDFKEFISKGEFDSLKLGKSKEWVLQNFPDPDGFEADSDWFDDVIWHYGDIELHFDKDKLFLIYSDYIDELNGGPSLSLDKWMLNHGEKLKLDQAIHYLNKNHIDYQKSTHNMVAVVELKMKSEVVLSFALPEDDNEDYKSYLEKAKISDQNQFTLISFSLMRE